MAHFSLEQMNQAASYIIRILLIIYCSIISLLSLSKLTDIIQFSAFIIELLFYLSVEDSRWATVSY